MSHVVPNNGHHPDEEDHRQGRTLSVVELAERLGIHLVGNHVGLKITTGHRSNDVENLQRSDRDGGEHHHDGPSDHGKRNPGETAPIARTIEHGRLDHFVGNILHRSGEYDHGKSGLNPDQNDNQKEGIPRRREKKILGFKPQPAVNRVEKPDFWLVLAGLEVIDKVPDHTGSHKRDSHGHEDEGLNDSSALHAVGHIRDSEADKGGQQRDKDNPEHGVAKNDLNLRNAEGPDVVVKADKVLAAFVHEGHPEGAQRWINQAHHKQQKRGAEKNSVTEPTLPLHGSA